MSLFSIPSSSAATHETLDAWLSGVFARLDDERASRARELSAQIDADGRAWLTDYMAKLSQGPRSNIADIMKTPGRTTAKKTRATTTTTKDRADWVQGLNVRLELSPLLSPASPARNVLSPLVPRSLNAQPASSLTSKTLKGKGRQKAAPAEPASPSKKPGKKRGRPKKANTASSAPVLADPVAQPRTNQPDEAQGKQSKSAPVRGKKTVVVEISAPARLERKMGAKATTTAQEAAVNDVEDEVVEEGEPEAIEVDAPAPGESVEVVAGDEVAERPVDPTNDAVTASDLNLSEPASISTRNNKSSQHPVSDDSVEDEAGVAAPDTNSHDDHEEPLHDPSDDEAPVAAPAQPMRQVRSSWLSKALINGAVAPSEMARKSTLPGDPRKSTAPSEFAKSTATTASAASSAPDRAHDRKSTVQDFALRKSLVPVGGLKRKSEAADDDRRPDKAAKVQVPAAAQPQPASVSAKPVPPVFSRTNSGPADVPASMAADGADARDRNRSDIHKVTRALEEMRERAAAKQKTEPAPALAPGGPPKQSTSTGTGFLRGLASVGRSLLGRNEEEDLKRAEREAEEDRRAQEEAEAELARLMNEMDENKAGDEMDDKGTKDDQPAKGDDKQNDVVQRPAPKRSATPPLPPSTKATVSAEPAGRMDVDARSDDEDEDAVNDSIGAISLPSLPQPELHDDDDAGPGPDHDIPSALGAVGIVDIDFDLPARPAPPPAAPAVAVPKQQAFPSSIPRALEKKPEPVAQSTTPRNSPPRRPPVLHGRAEKHERAERPTPVTAKAARKTGADNDVDMADDEDDEAYEPVSRRRDGASKPDAHGQRSRAPSSVHMLGASTASQASILGSASMIASKKLGIKPAVGQVKSLQLASSALRKEQNAGERKAQLAKQNEARRAEAARRKAEEDRLAAEEDKRRAAREDAERRKRMADALAKKKEREEQVAKALKAKQAKEEKEAAAKRAAEEDVMRRREEEFRKRKAQQPLSRSTSAMSVAPPLPAGPMKKIAPPPPKHKDAPPFRPAPALPAAATAKLGSQAKMGPNVFRVADTAATSTIRPVGGAGPARASHMQPQPAASVLQQSRVALQSQLDSAGGVAGAAADVVSEDIVLPDIASEYSDSDDSDRETDFKRPAWAESPELRSALEAQAHVNPDDLFGAIRPLNMEELFRQRSEKFRKRTSSANWAGADRLTEAEEREYARRMGFRNAPAGPSGLRKESTAP
ncbi:hypothetical protein Q5752_004500 [Cryptotrichosporon argae]